MADLFGLHWATVLGLPSVVWVSIITPPIVAVIMRMGSLPPRTQDGWHQLAPTIPFFLLLALGFVLATLFTVSVIVAAMLFVREGIMGAGLFLLLAIPMAWLGWYTTCYTFYYIFLVRIRFNDGGIEWQRSRTSESLSWREIAIIRRHWLFGPVIVSVQGKTYQVWEYLRGYRALIEAARVHGVNISSGLLSRRAD